MSRMAEVEKKTRKRVLKIVKQIEKENNSKYNCNEKFSPRDRSCIEIGYVHGCIDCKEKLNKLINEHNVPDSIAEELLASIFN